MTKELLQIEFRYRDAPNLDRFGEYKTKMVTIGVFDTFEDAAIEGNKLMETLESKFPLHIFPQGNEAVKKRFSKNGGCFGSSKRLVTNLAYLKTPFEFYAKITRLDHDNVNEVISEALEAGKRYKNLKNSND